MTPAAGTAKDLRTFVRVFPRKRPSKVPASLPQCKPHERQRWVDSHYASPPYLFRAVNCVREAGGACELASAGERELVLACLLGHTVPAVQSSRTSVHSRFMLAAGSGMAGFTLAAGSSRAGG